MNLKKFDACHGFETYAAFFKKMLVFVGVLLFSMSVFAQDTEEPRYEDKDPEKLVKAPKDVIKSATEECRSWANDDEVEEAKLAAYLLNCVNDELRYQGYLPVSSITQ